ncbi:hypothetical protein FE257_004946 [Aspergillus nanangensis]|uniref:Uncharacterized protein n=1 Tax=Aspergillus nanangensis TaxID=2582783 RepID=A0AAD4CAH9_ASPNN|nr:hypothetical protein FE257_004946 [Aspergillus nanangensis]
MRVLPGLFRTAVFYLIWNPSQVVAEEPPPPTAVSEIPDAEDVFSMPPTGVIGNCDVVPGAIDEYLTESVLLVNAATTAIARYKTDKIYRQLFAAWLGIEWDESVSPAELEDESKPLWDTVNDRFSSVAQFLRQGGIKNSRTSQKPWLFCGDAFAVKKGWGDIAKDANGEDAVKETNEKGEATEYYKIQDLYGSLNNGIREPFWVDKLKGYDFDNDGEPRLCGRAGRYAATLPASQGIHHYEHTADFDAHVFMCPTAFNPGSLMRPHSKPALAAILQDTIYPQEGGQFGLDFYATQSCTLYHELFHLTDYRGTSGDFFEELTALSHASLGDDYADKLNVANNAESYVMFSLAAYIYQNPPAGKKPVAFLRGGEAFFKENA